MKTTIILLLLCCLCTFTALAQNRYSIKGIAADTTLKAKLAGTTIMVLNQKDSIMRAFAWAGADGSFNIGNLPKGKFLLLLTYPGYADFVDFFTLDSAHTSHDFGSIAMVLKSKLLQDVIVKGEVDAIKIKGDTTEFNAKAYKVQPNASVEDLLKQLPGIQIDKDGKITAQGQTVPKVLVDGEEFFGDDPTLVTRNLRADMVDKVQLYDKKSDQATFTGIDDGQRTKTINIKLKQDKKNGTFGKINGNQGTDGYYEDQLQYNRFKANEKFALYGTAANDGRLGLGFQDSNALGVGNSNVQFGDDGSMMIFGGGGSDELDSFSGYYDNGQGGLPVTSSAGAHYDSKWDGDKQTINANYKIGQIDVTGTTSTISQETLPTGVLDNNNSKNFNEYAFRQKADIAYTLKIDTTATLKVTADGTLRNFHVDNDYITQTDTSGRLINHSTRDIKNHGTEQIFNASALYTKKFHKVGRTFSWNLSEKYDNTNTDGYLNSEIDYYKNGIKDSTQNINQYKPTNTLNTAFRSSMTYTEPITKKWSVMFSYNFALNNASSNNRSYDETAPGSGIYSVFDTTYSNYYKYNQVSDQGGAVFNYKGKKSIFNIGTRVSDDNYKQIDEYNGNIMQRNFINWYPQARYSYKFGPQSSLNISYFGNTTQPNLQQIQPIVTNTDPLNVTLGNPDLKPSFSNRIYGSYNSYQVISGQQFFINGSIGNTLDEIVNKTTTDLSTGKTTTQYVNLTGLDPYSYNLWADLGRKIKSIDTYVGLDINASSNLSYSYSNGDLDKSNNSSYGARLTIQKSVEKKYDIGLGGGPTYSISKMSLTPQLNNNAPGFNTGDWVNVYLPLKFGAGSDISYTYTAGTQAFGAQQKTIWNAYVFKTFLKDDKLKISLSVNDLLNQNVNFSRGISGNTYTETNTTGIRRFFMFSVLWDFTKFSTTKSSN